MVSPSEEVALARKIKHGDKRALDKLVRANLRFVVSIAKQYRDSGVPFSDLISEGNVGLLQAARKFDPSRGVKFITYAVRWIRNSILAYIKDWRNEEEKDLDTLPEEEYENIADSVNEEFEEELLDLQAKKSSVEDLLKCLEKRELKIITMFYGLKTGRGLTLDEVGTKLHISSERVRQIKEKAITKLKCHALSQSDGDTRALWELCAGT